MGVVFGDRLALESALLIELRDDIARRTLITMQLNDVDYAMHHLVEGRFIISLRRMCLTMDIDILSIVKHIRRKGTLIENKNNLAEVERIAN
jgi:hypothetical protein